MFTASIWSLENVPRVTVIKISSLMCYKKQLLSGLSKHQQKINLTLWDKLKVKLEFLLQFK